MKKRAFFLVGVLLVLLPGVATAWRAHNWHQVVQVSDGVFEVIGRSGSGAVDYWCGAGDYVRHEMRQSATQRIYIWRAIGPSATQSGRKAVQFSLNAPQNVSTSPGISLSTKAVGDNLTAAAAFQYCLQNDFQDRLVPWN